tara:strand:+ start:6301 stop:6762 length:462 start_codon:yes stop_codon:yes gene_type:complete
MANQDPQPEIYTTRYTFDASAANVVANTSQVVSIYTNQANNEEVRIYGIAVRVDDENNATATNFNDFAVSIQVGANNVPSNQFDVSWLANNIANGGGILMFPSPVLVLFQQPLSVTVTTRSQIDTAANRERRVVVDLIGELAIQKAPPGYRGV